MRELFDGNGSAEHIVTRMKVVECNINESVLKHHALRLHGMDDRMACVPGYFVISSHWARGVVASRLDTRSLALVSNALCLSETRETYVAAVRSDSTSRRP